MQAQFLSLGKFTQTSIYSNEHALYFFYILYSKKMSVRNAKVAYRLCDNKLKYFFIIFYSHVLKKIYTCNISYLHFKNSHTLYLLTQSRNLFVTYQIDVCKRLDSDLVHK